MKSRGNKEEPAVGPIPYSKRGFSVLNSLQKPEVVTQYNSESDPLNRLAMGLRE